MTLSIIDRFRWAYCRLFERLCCGAQILVPAAPDRPLKQPNRPRRWLRSQIEQEFGQGDVCRSIDHQAQRSLIVMIADIGEGITEVRARLIGHG